MENQTLMEVDVEWNRTDTVNCLKLAWSWVIGANTHSILKLGGPLTKEQIDYEFKKNFTNIDNILKLPKQVLSIAIKEFDKEYKVEAVIDITDIPDTAEQMFGE